MELRKKTIRTLAETITGDNKISFYRTGSELVEFFNEFGFDDSYEEGFPARWKYAQDKLIEIIQQNQFVEFINYCLDEGLYFEKQFVEYETQDMVLKHWDKYLKFDNYEIIRQGNTYRLKDLKYAQIHIKVEEMEPLSTDFMNQQIEKCDKKILDADYDGAITNARSLVEEVLLALEERATGERGKNKGDISEIYNRVKKHVNFDPSQKDLNDTLKQILTGLNSVVIGIGRLRTKASDSHAREYKPSRHHAELAVNSAKTFTSFIISSYLYQQEKNKMVTTS